MAGRSIGATEISLYAGLQGGVCVAAATFGSMRAFALTFMVAVLAALRYASISFVGRSLGSSRFGTLAAASVWFASFIALFALLFVTGLAARAFLPWAAAAALAGPIACWLAALFRGFAAVASHRRERTAA